MLTEVWKDKSIHRGLSVVPKTDGEIYVSVSIGEHIITFTCFLHCAKKRSCCWKYWKWGCHLKNRYRKNIYDKVVENARINFSVSPYCNLLFSRKDNLKFFEAALAVVFCNDVVGSIMNVWGYRHWNTVNTILDIYLLFCKTVIKIIKQGVKFVQTYQVYYDNWLSSW